MQHEVVKCSCGAIIAQCRCISPDKTVRVIDSGCQDCQARLAGCLDVGPAGAD